MQLPTSGLPFLSAGMAFISVYRFSQRFVHCQLLIVVWFASAFAGVSCEHRVYVCTVCEGGSVFAMVHMRMAEGNFRCLRRGLLLFAQCCVRQAHWPAFSEEPAPISHRRTWSTDACSLHLTSWGAGVWRCELCPQTLQQMFYPLNPPLLKSYPALLGILF